MADEEVEERLKQIGEGARSYAAREEGVAAETGDRLTISYLSKLDGEPFEVALTIAPRSSSARAVSSPASKSSWLVPRSATRRSST